MNKRKFYRSVIEVEVLSEDPIPDTPSLTDVDEQITEGDWSGTSKFLVHNQEVDGPTMARLLKAQGSDPEFFQLTEDGKDTEDES